MKKQARIIYNEPEDSFDVEIMIGEGWGLIQRYRCVAKEGCPYKEYINFDILCKIEDLNYLGYEVRVEV